jgi:hypothetical protein
MNIAQISNLGSRGASLLALIIQVAPFLQAAEFRLDASSHLVIKDADTSTGTAARAEGNDAQIDAQVPTTTARSLALYTREISIDEVRTLDKNVGISPAGLKLFADRRLTGLAGKLAIEIQDDCFIGLDASNEMLGLGVFVKDATSGGQTTKLGFTTAELAAMNTQISLQLNDTTNQNSFVESLIKEISNVPGANALVMNSNLYARMSTIAYRIGAAGETRNSFGQPVKTFNNVPMIAVPTTTITQTESDGSNSDCTSMYILRFAEDQGVCFNTNSGFAFTDFPDNPELPGQKARMSFYLNLVCERTDAMKRLSRIRL